MNRQVGRSAVALFSLVFLSTLIFVLLENKALSKTQPQAAGRPDAAVEIADPQASTGPMDDCAYDLYRKDGDRLTPVAPSELDYADPASINDVALREFDVATGEVPPATRQVTITLNAVCVNKNDCSTLQTGDALVITYEIEAPTKTIELEDGTLQTVYVLPPRVDTYVAVRTPNGNLFFLNRLSTVSNKYYVQPVLFAGNMPINSLAGSLLGTLMRSNLAPGYYKVYTVMVPPGQSVYSDPNTYISNLAELEFNYNFAQP